MRIVAEHENAADEATVTSRRFGPAYAALAAQLRAERERQGLTQRDLARRIEGYSTSLCNWEKGRSVPGIAPLAIWAAGLGLELVLVPIGSGGANVAELRAELAAANERAEKAEARLVKLHAGLQIDDGARALVQQNRRELDAVIQQHVEQLGAENCELRTRAEQAEVERDEARARLAELGEAMVEWTVGDNGNEAGLPVPEQLARLMAVNLEATLKTRTAYHDPPWRPAAEPADVAQDGRSATDGQEAGDA